MNTLIIKTTNPTGLLKAIKDSIDANTIRTWEYDSDGDFTHVPEQWQFKAYLRPDTSKVGRLEFMIMWPKDSAEPNAVYSVYHGRFIEMILTHFRRRVTDCTALPKGD